MSDLPGAPEVPGIGATPEIKDATLPTPEASPPVEAPTPKVEKEEPVEVALPPVLQPDQPQPLPVAAAKPISDEHLNRGRKVSKLTPVALRTFQELQRKLAIYYEKLRGGKAA